jgi:hypothetical protein
MQTYIEYKELVDHPNYTTQKNETLTKLIMADIDPAFVKLVNLFNSRSFCFTLQCCSGHFSNDNIRLDIPSRELFNQGTAKYHLAYIALCIQNSPKGKKLIKQLKQISLKMPDYIQFGCARWFWKKTINSYVLQVEPVAFKDKDFIQINQVEAGLIEEARKVFLMELGSINTPTPRFHSEF